MMPIKTTINWLGRFLKYRILHVDDTPHRIALSIALAIFMAWTPAIGLQTVGLLLLCLLFGANKLVGLPFVWVSNPATLMPIYYPNYLFGRWILNSPTKEIKWGAALTGPDTWWRKIQNWWELTNEIVWPLWVGSLLIGLALGAIVYVGAYYGVIYYRKARPHLRLKLPHRYRRRRRSPVTTEEEIKGTEH